MSKVLFIINSLAGGGAEKLLYDILPLGEMFESNVLVLSKIDDKYTRKLIDKGIIVDCIPISVKGHLKIIKYIKDYINKGKYDIVHAHLFPVIYYCSIAKKIEGAKFPILIMTEHSTDNRRRHIPLFRPIEKWIYDSYDSVVSISEQTQNSLLKWLKIDKKNKYIVINNGIDLDLYKDISKNESHIFKRDKDGSIYLCIIGSLKPVKNHKMMIDILSDLPTTYKLIIVGDGPLKNELIRVTEERLLGNRVIFLGFRSDIPDILHNVDIVVIPSKWEGFGLVAVEAMASGCPVIASNVPGLSEVIDKGGILVGSKDEFVNSILALENAEYYEQMSKKAVEQAIKFDINTTRNKYISLYDKLINN